MSLNELWPSLRDLSKAEKFRLMQFLIADIAREDNIDLLEANRSYPVWSPYDAFEAAETLLNELEASRK